MATYSVLERVSVKYTATIKDEAGTAIPGSALTALTLTLYSVHSGTIVNSRNDQNVLNANGVTVDEAGLLTWIMDPLDNQVLDTAFAYERHRALFEWTWSGGTKAGKHEVDFLVQNLGQVP